MPVINAIYQGKAQYERTTKVEIITTSGTWTPPKRFINDGSLDVRLFGGGGRNALGIYGGGGGHMAHSLVTLSAAEISGGVNITIGAAAAADGITGGITSFGAHLSANGGSGIDGGTGGGGWVQVPHRLWADRYIYRAGEGSYGGGGGGCEIGDSSATPGHIIGAELRGVFGGNGGTYGGSGATGGDSYSRTSQASGYSTSERYYTEASSSSSMAYCYTEAHGEGCGRGGHGYLLTTFYDGTTTTHDINWGGVPGTDGADTTNNSSMADSTRITGMPRGDGKTDSSLGSGGGGYGGRGGAGNVSATADGQAHGGGGGGYGGNGGDATNAGPGGGGGFGGPGGSGDQGSFGGGYGPDNYGSGWGYSAAGVLKHTGKPGVCVLIYDVWEAV